ncbi:MAG: hypothetical protein IPL92_17550 [Saprospiraceae bacterium]|nr:hypothetical protein [Candidatus Opimibacter iunctus]
MKIKHQPALESDKGAEDLESLITDTDGDGDLDLVVTTVAVVNLLKEIHRSEIAPLPQ